MDVKKLRNFTEEDSILQTMYFSCSSSSSKHVFPRSFSTKTSPSTSPKSLFKRSFSTKTLSSPSPESQFTRSFSTKALSSSSSSDPTFRRSFSTKPKTSKSLFDLSRNSSTKCSSDLSSKSSLSRCLSQKGASVTQKWCRVAKEHKSRLYIIKRCVLMLVCWHKHS
ncbi:small polypeptide DEVIL 15 [Brassica napus]|uniref:small polypeptide DEVIL 15 n=1 Tax=Brassica napus TaxID=3708 RepID=UPI0006AAA489|nr:small polypeptide DEVIL 15 [Brassica napus]